MDGFGLRERLVGKAALELCLNIAAKSVTDELGVVHTKRSVPSCG